MIYYICNKYKNLLGVSRTKVTPSMISMLLDRVALLRALIVFTNIQLKNALSCSTQFRFWDGCTSVGPAAVYAARSISVRNLFIFSSSNHSSRRRGKEYRDTVVGDGTNCSPENFRNKVWLGPAALESL